MVASDDRISSCGPLLDRCELLNKLEGGMTARQTIHLPAFGHLRHRRLYRSKRDCRLWHHDEHYIDAMMHAMRTTVTLDPDVAAKLRAVMQTRGLPFKTVLNDAVRAGLAAPQARGRTFRVTARPMGLRPGINLDKSLLLAGELEDGEVIRKLELRK